MPLLKGARSQQPEIRKSFFRPSLPVAGWPFIYLYIYIYTVPALLALLSLNPKISFSFNFYENKASKAGLCLKLYFFGALFFVAFW